MKEAGGRESDVSECATGQYIYLQLLHSLGLMEGPGWGELNIVAVSAAGQAIAMSGAREHPGLASAGQLS